MEYVMSGRNAFKKLGGTSAAYTEFNWAEVEDSWHRPSTVFNWGDRVGSGPYHLPRVSFAQKTDGSYYVVCTDGVDLAVCGSAPSLIQLTTTNDSVTDWQSLPMANVNFASVNRVDDKLFLTVQDLGVGGVRPASHKLYRSNSGNGDDFTLVTTLSSALAIDESHIFDSIEMDGTGEIVKLASGRYIMGSGIFRYEYEYLVQHFTVLYSDNQGETWNQATIWNGIPPGETERDYFRAYAFSGDYYMQDAPFIRLMSDGTLVAGLGVNQAGLDYERFHSTNNGATWHQHHMTDTDEWDGDGHYRNDFEHISDGHGNLFVVCNDMVWGYVPTVFIYHWFNPINNELNKTTTRTFTNCTTPFRCLRTRAKIVEGILVVTVGMALIPIAIAKTTRIRNVRTVTESLGIEKDRVVKHKIGTSWGGVAL